jgi:hypothetical protein
MDTRLRIARAIEKTEGKSALKLMKQVKDYAPEEGPPAIATDGKGAYREAMLETWGKVPEYSGIGRKPTALQPGEDWLYEQIVKEKSGSKLIGVKVKFVYGDPEKIKAVLGEHTAYIERTNLTTRQMNGRLVRKTLSYSKELQRLIDASTLEDALYNFTRPVRTLRVELEEPTEQARWQQRTPAMAGGLTDHIWTVKELLHLVLVPASTNN